MTKEVAAVSFQEMMQITGNGNVLAVNIAAIMAITTQAVRGEQCMLDAGNRICELLIGTYAMLMGLPLPEAETRAWHDARIIGARLCSHLQFRDVAGNA